MEVIFISSHFLHLSGPLSLSMKFEEDWIIGVKDMPN